MPASHAGADQTMDMTAPLLPAHNNAQVHCPHSLSYLSLSLLPFSLSLLPSSIPFSLPFSLSLSFLYLPPSPTSHLLHYIICQLIYKILQTTVTLTSVSTSLDKWQPLLPGTIYQAVCLAALTITILCRSCSASLFVCWLVNELVRLKEECGGRCRNTSHCVTSRHSTQAGYYVNCPRNTTPLLAPDRSDILIVSVSRCTL